MEQDVKDPELWKIAQRRAGFRTHVAHLLYHEYLFLDHLVSQPEEYSESANSDRQDSVDCVAHGGLGNRCIF